jgi:hypothetical protein
MNLISVFDGICADPFSCSNADRDRLSTYIVDGRAAVRMA